MFFPSISLGSKGRMSISKKMFSSIVGHADGVIEGFKGEAVVLLEVADHDDLGSVCAGAG